jgi:septal ring factor EnvC (AmiA/AmiB activator)
MNAAAPLPDADADASASKNKEHDRTLMFKPTVDVEENKACRDFKGSERRRQNRDGLVSKKRELAAERQAAADLENRIDDIETDMQHTVEEFHSLNTASDFDEDEFGCIDDDG